MALIDICLANVKRYEGFRAKPYKDTVGVLTIGYGTNLDAGISEPEAEYLAINRLAKVITPLSLMDFWEALDDTRRSVLVDMAYNMGINGLLGFRNMLDAIRAEDFDTAAAQMLASKWASQVGQRAIDLSNQMKVGVA